MSSRSYLLWRLVPSTLAVVTAVSLSSCGGGGEGENKEGESQHIETEHTAPSGPVVPKAYDEPAWQARFEFWYLKHLNLYQPIEQGNRVRLQFKEASDVIGSFIAYTESMVEVQTEFGTTNFAPDTLTQNTRELLIASEFAFSKAKEMVDAERAKDPTTPPTGEIPVTDEGLPILEQRFAAAEGAGLDIRRGPGKHYRILKDAQVQKGELIAVLEENGGWIRFLTSNSEGKPLWAWVSKFSTIPAESVDLPRQEDDIKTLTADGVILSFDPTNNVAVVDASLWTEMDFLVRQGVGRTLAFYCGNKRGTGLNWVDIKDGSGKRIAKYSEAMGFKIYQ
ncbi:MAG: hypothetical protein V1929_13760 [bacterium]